MVIEKIFELSEEDLVIYNNMLAKFVSMAEQHRIIPRQAFENIRNNVLELSTYLPHLDQPIEDKTTSTSLVLLNKAVPIMKVFDAELADNLEKNSKEIKAFIRKTGGVILELSEEPEDTVQDVTDYKKIAKEIIKVITNPDGELTLQERLCSASTPQVKSIARELVDEYKKRPMDRQTSEIYQIGLNAMKESMRGKLNVESDTHKATQQLLSEVCSKINAERKEQKARENKVNKLIEKHANNQK